MPQRVVCLIPARNAAADLPRCLASAALVCDAVIALDDGSTDETRRVLDEHPSVARILTNPVRSNYSAWDDAENRNRLLDAAADFAPDWILSLDADERIDSADAAVLRQFIDTDALPGCAYGFHHIAMRGDSEHCLPRSQWIYRLFSFAPGQRFPELKLHFVPIPTAIPRSLWFRTTIRIQHYGSVSAERRMARFEKYAEADPERRYQADYAHLLHNPAPSELVRWRPRPPNLPVLDRGEPPPSEANSATAVALSAIVIAQKNAATIARTVGSVVNQVVPEPFETIVVVSGSPETAAIVRDSFPSVTLVELDRPALPGAARNAGLAKASGEFVSFPGSHVELPHGSLAARLAAHRRGYALVTGIAVNGNHTPAGWASYFLDHHEGLPGHGASIIEGAPAHCSYARQPLIEAGVFPEDRRTGEDTAVNRLLTEHGYVAIRDAQIHFLHRSPCRTVPRLVRHHFTRGRGWGRLQLDAHRRSGRLITRELLRDRLLGHLPRRLARIDETVRAADPAVREAYAPVKRVIALGVASAWAGMWFEMVKPEPGKQALLWGAPVQTLAIVTPEPAASVTVVEIDLVKTAVRRAVIPLHLPAPTVSGETRPLADALGLGNVTAPLPELLDHLQHALDLDLDGVIVARTGDFPLDRGAVVEASLPDRELRRTLRRLAKFQVREEPPLGGDEDKVRAALGNWRSPPVAGAPDPEIWMP